MVPGLRLDTVTWWLATMVVSSAVIEPYPVVVPYSTWELAGALVCHVTTAVVMVAFAAAAFEIVRVPPPGGVPCTIPVQPVLNSTALRLSKANKMKRNPWHRSTELKRKPLMILPITRQLVFSGCSRAGMAAD